MIDDFEGSDKTKTLLVYYSYTGNTEKLAEKIMEEKDYDIVRIETVTPYTDDYDEMVEKVREDVHENTVPEIRDINVNLDDYDVIILGTPVWWYTCALPVTAFLDKYDLSNKTIIPFVTNGGTVGHTIKDIAKKGHVQDEILLTYNDDKLKNDYEFEIWLNNLDD